MVVRTSREQLRWSTATTKTEARSRARLLYIGPSSIVLGNGLIVTITTKMSTPDIDIGCPRWKGDEEGFFCFESNRREHIEEESCILKEGCTQALENLGFTYFDQISENK